MQYRAGAIGALLLCALTVAQAIEKVELFADFEAGLGDWIAEGDAFGASPAEGDRWDRYGGGLAFADSLYNGEAKTGILRSPTFTCPDEIRFTANGWDLRDGSGGRNFFRLRGADGKIIAQSVPPLCSGKFVPMRWDVSDHKGQPVHIEVVDGAADGAFAWLAIDDVRLVDYGPLVQAQNSDLYAVTAGPNAKHVRTGGLAFALWDAPPAYPDSSHSVALNCPAQELYLLGHVSSHDFGCMHWGYHNDFTRDFTCQQMIGDEAGSIRIEYGDGTATTIPLIFGFTLWWNKPWMNNREPIASVAGAREAFEQSCHLRETAFEDGSLRFACAIECEDKSIERVVFTDSAAKRGFPEFWALSVRTRAPSATLTPLSHHAYDEAWLAAHRISADLVESGRYLKALSALKSQIGMTDADLPTHVARDRPEGFTGPDMVVKGGVLADILTNAYYHTTHSAATASIREDGYIHCAPPDMPDYNAYNSIGTYQVISRGATSSWTRGYEYLRDLAQWGYVDEVTRAVDWTDSCLWHYPRKSPLRYERDGKMVPWPAHWATTADHPPDSLDPGQNEIPGDENDGHALTMMMRYAAWLATGKDIQWLRERWSPAVAAADWLCFVLDYTKQDALYCESEGNCYGVGFDPKARQPYETYPHYEVFSSTVGWLALLQSAEMAKALGKRDQADRWREYARRIRGGMSRRCVQQDPDYGKVWRVHPNSVWPQFDERLAPVFELPYYHGFDSALMDEELLAISRNSFRLQIGDPPDYHHGLGLGYGQGWIAAAALLLDEMQAAAPLLDNLARYMYFPKHPHPFTATEGVVVNEDGDFRVRNGTVGIDEGLFVTRVFRVMMGVDDLKPEDTALMPRLPGDYSDLRVRRHPALTRRDEQPLVTRISYRYHTDAQGCSVQLWARDPIAHLRVRLGPFEAATTDAVMHVNGSPRQAVFTPSGDSWWVWVDLGHNVKRASCRLAL